MKFSVSSTDLLKHLQTVGGAIGSNAVLPILESFLFTIEDNRLHLSGSDLETSIKTSLDVHADSDGSIAIPAKILLDTLKQLPEQPLTFALDLETNAVKITSAYGSYKLSGESGADFPRLPEANETEQVVLPVGILQQAISKTLFATSSDELRPAMTGVFFQVDFNKITFVATDAHKLVRYTVTSDVESKVATSFIVPKKALNLLKGSLPNGGTVSLAFNKSNAFFTIGDVQLICRLIDARYPDYNAVIPTENPNKMTITRSQFLSSLKRINIYANKTTNQVVLNLKDDLLGVSAKDLDFSNEAEEQLPCTLEGDAMGIAFNAKFLIEMLNVLEGDEVRLNLSTSSRAGILQPMEQPAGEDILMLVMPVMLS